MMKNFKLNLITVLSLLLILLSCDKDDITANDNNKNYIEVSPVSGGKPDAVSATYKFGATIEDVFGTAASARPTKLYTNDAWKPITKDRIKQVGYASESAIYNAYTAKYNAVNGVSIGTTLFNLSFGRNNITQHYGFLFSNGQNPHVALNLQDAKFRFKGEGTVSQNTAPSAWAPVSTVNARVERNYTNAPVNIGGTLWFSTATSTSKEVTVEVSGSVSVTAAVSIPFVADGSTDITLGGSRSVTKNTSKTFTENFNFPHIRIPSRKAVRFQLEERWVPVKTTWKLPVEFWGHFGTNQGFNANNNQWRYSFLKVSEFNIDFDKPGKYQTATVTEHLSHEFQVAAYIIN